MSTSTIRVSYAPPLHGWLTLTVVINERVVEIDASDVPHNPVEELLSALELAANGMSSSVWWHLEPDGYFMYFLPLEGGIHLKIVLAPNSVPAQGTTIAKYCCPSGALFRSFKRTILKSHTGRTPIRAVF